MTQIKVLPTIRLIFIQLLIFLTLGEITTRIFFPKKIQTNTSALHGTLKYDAIHGWLSKPYHTFNQLIPDITGKETMVNYQTSKYGFRAFGNTQQDSLPRVLFIGDSYTQAVEASNNKVFYNILKDSIPMEVFAYGAAAYGTLQEYLIFEKYYDEIKPDLVIWQFCTNDFLDNHYELERRSKYGMKARRPYLNINGEQEYKFGEKEPFLLKYSHLIYQLNRIRDRIANGKEELESAQEQIAQKGLEYPLFKESVAITDTLLQRIKTKINGQSDLVFFLSDHYQPQLKIARKIIKSNNIPFISENQVLINKAKHDGIPYRSADKYHWNNTGHYLVAMGLIQGLKRLEFIE